MNKKSIRDINVAGKRVLMRVDYNVPMDEHEQITDDTRIVASIPTINYLLEQGASVILISHLGRPKGKVQLKYSLAPIAKHLELKIGRPVTFAADCLGERVQELAGKMVAGDILMLENLRFHPEEEENDWEFAEDLATLADIYVNDGFGVSHRAHASTEGVAHFLPSVAGLLLEKEIQFVGGAVANPQRPFAAIIGGAKVSDKIGVIENLLDKVDVLVIGGGMANTFLAAEGFKMGRSLVEADKYELAKTLISKAQAKGVKLYLPVDMIVADCFSAEAQHHACAIGEIPQDWMALDIGPQSRELFAKALEGMRMVVWNGPMGVFEMEAFCGGTEAVAHAVAGSGAISIVGGGDSVAAIEKLGLAEQITHISTGGGASLEYLEGKVLPGIDCLDEIRKPLIAGNWKMHKTVTEGVQLAKEIVQLTNGALAEVVIFPPFTALENIADAIDGKHVGYGAQNMHWAQEGAFTGEISGKMLQDIGCEYVLLGHSERRHIFGEDLETIAKKLQTALNYSLKPVLCVGETLAEREAGQTEAVITAQLQTALANLDSSKLLDMVIAYEPVWAIGTGKTATAEQAAQVASFIRTYLLNNCGEIASRNIRILYGGSVNEKNIAELMAAADIDGALVGGASLQAESFANIVRY